MADILKKAEELKKIWGSFRPARVLLTANNFRVFDYLQQQKSAEKLSKNIGADRRTTEILLDALTGLGLLKKQRGLYKNNSIASKFLVSDNPYYQGDIIRHADTLWKNWSGLDEVIKTGNPYRKAQNHDAFILGMHNLASLKVKNVIKIIGLKGVKTALDLGGGPGTYSIEMAKKGVSVTLFDRPETVKIAKRVINNAPRPPLKLRGGEGGVNFIQGDFLYDDIGKGYDLIFASQILHSNSEKDNLHLLKKCNEALNKGGRIVIQEFYVSEDRTHPVHSTLFSVNMLVNTEEGKCYSPDEMKNWLSKTGLTTIRESFIDDCVLISGES
ncbi:MAG: methyltransferase domain-containing protein [Nitrospirae bacterium]|nr:methyltransferase domain-containing protein [Nitrospirota bacterium]